MRGSRIIVVGGGVFGLAVALTAAWQGAKVVLYEPRTIGDSASGVAGGMLAPAFEAGLDPLLANRFDLLRAARDRWPAFADRLGEPLLDRAGALRVATVQDRDLVAPLISDLRTQGARSERLTGGEARRLQPMLSDRIVEAVYTPDDWRLDPVLAFRAMAAAFEHAEGEIVRRLFRPDAAHGSADAIVLATGARSREWVSAAPALSRLEPIKGQILHYEAEPSGGPVVRGALGYVVPQARGALAGASMELGVADAAPVPAILNGLRSSAVDLFPHLADARARGLAGVRAGTPDGLPLVGEVEAGRDGTPRLFLAVGARRNGWLLAPLVGETLVALMAGEPAGVAALFDPQRFETTTWRHPAPVPIG